MCRYFKIQYAHTQALCLPKTPTLKFLKMLRFMHQDPRCQANFYNSPNFIWTVRIPVHYRPPVMTMTMAKAKEKMEFERTKNQQRKQNRHLPKMGTMAHPRMEEMQCRVPIAAIQLNGQIRVGYVLSPLGYLSVQFYRLRHTTPREVAIG